ncbi:MAG TPA: NusG domain II-containing protein [Firmicutes bacterium]|nr:NusG domain II-containing protein [Bacillota bacterium]
MTTVDRWLMVALLILGLTLMGWRVWGDSSRSAQVVVTVNGETILNLELSPNQSGRYLIPLERGQAVLEVDDGAVRLQDMEGLCPRRICSHTGWIRKQGESILCVPNKLLIRILGAEGESVDALSR